MTRDIPSLNAIRFFECAARHESFTRAGVELFVTQSAVSRQIKLLEEELDCELFTRQGPNLRLTSDGEDFQQTVGYALDIIRAGTATLRRKRTSALTVSLLPNFAANWLIPRIPRIEELDPTLSIRLESSFTFTDFAQRTDIDVAIRLGKGPWPGLYSTQLTNDHLMPVCSPEVAKTINCVEDLANHTLLVDEKIHDEWPMWFKVAGKPYLAKNTRHYNDTLIQIRASIRGLGISLCRRELITEYLQSGELISLFDIECISEVHFHFVCPAERIKEEKIRRLRDLLLQVA